MANGTRIGTIYLDFQLKGLEQIRKQVGTIGKDVSKNLGQAGRASQQMGKQMQRSFGQTMKYMLNFQNFVAKIVHYITFSIGVQLVMGIKRGFESLIQTFTEFERAIINAVTISGFLGGAFDDVTKRVGDLAKELGRTTVFSANEVAKAFYSLASSGIDISKITKNELIPILDYAAATQTDLDTATQAVVITMKQFRMGMEETKRIVDVFTTSITTSFMTMEKMADMMRYSGAIAGVLGVQFEELVAAGTALTNVGYTGAQSGQRLNMIFTRLLDPTEEAKEMLMGLGIEIEDLNPETHSLVEILYRLQAAGAGAAEMAQMFRARTAGAAAALIDSADAVARMVTRYEMAEGITRRVAASQEETLWGALKKVGNEFINMAVTLGEKLKPTIVFLADFIKSAFSPAIDTLGAMFGFMTEHGETFKNILKVLTALLAVYIFKRLVLWAKHLKIVIALLALRNSLTLLATKITGAYAISLGALTVANAGVVTSSMKAIAALKALKFAMLSTPLGWFVVAIGAVITALALWKVGAEELTDIQKEVAKSTTALQKHFKNFEEETADLAFTATGLYTEMRSLRGSWDEIEKQAADEFFEKLGEALGISSDAAEDLNLSTQEQRDAVIAVAKEARGLYSEQVELIEAQFVLRDAFDDYATALYRAELATIALQDSEDALNKEGGDTIENRERLIKAEKKYNETQKDLIKYSGAVLQAIRRIPGNLEHYINVLEEANEAEATRISRQDDLDRLTREVDRATQDYTEALLEYGAASEEAADAEERLMDAIDARIELQDELNDLQDVYSEKMWIINKVLDEGIFTLKDAEDATKKLFDREIEILRYANEIIGYREEITKWTAEQAIWEAKLATLETVRADHSKYLNEQLLKLYEAEDKIYDIEYKLYRLRQDEDEQLDALFQSLAEQGLINDEMIQDYSDMMKSEGDVLKLNHAFAKVMGDLTPEQREYVEALMDSIKGSNEYNKALSELAGAPGLDIIIAMDDAQDKLKSSTDDLSDSMIPLMDSWVDMGIVSSESAKQFYDIVDNAYELAAGEKNLLKQQDKLSENFEGVLNIISQLAMSLIDGEEGAETLADVWSELTDILGIGETGIEELNSILGTSKSALGAFSREELILAATLKTTASDLGTYERGMSGATIASNLGIVSASNLKNAISLLIDKVSTSLQPLTSYKVALEKVGEAANQLKDFIGHVKDGFAALYEYIEGHPLEPKVNHSQIDDLMVTINSAKEVLGDLGITMKTVTPVAPRGFIPDVQKAREDLYEVMGIEGIVSEINPALAKLLFKARGGITSGPTPAIIGERGAEAVIPLEGANKKFGKDILDYIIPKYYPELMKQRGGIAGATYNRNITYTSGPSATENITITGPIQLPGVRDVSGFMNELKLRARASKRI